MSTEARQFKTPTVNTSLAKQIVDGVWVIPDIEHTMLVPNIGIIVGSKATLIIDTGFGSINAEAVLQKARKLSDDRPIFLTHTHCHPEHGFGANVVADEVTIVYNENQWSELEEKGPILLRMFRDQIPPLAPMLDGVEFIKPDILYSGSLQLNLGGLLVEFREFGGAHSRGDQVIIVRSATSVLFTGDLVEEGYFGVLGDDESHVPLWIERLKGLEQLNPTIVIPGHGSIGGKDLITGYHAYLEFTKRRVNELRKESLSESEIVEKVGDELLNLHPDWRNRDWARKTVEDLTWPARR